MSIASIHDLFRNLWSQKGRAISTLMGIVWGTLSVVLLLAFGLGMHAEFKTRGAGLGKSITIIWPSNTTMPFEGLGEGRPIRLTEADVLSLPEQIPDIDLISPEYTSRVTLQLGDQIQRVALTGVYPQYGELRSMHQEPGGRFLNDRDLAEYRRVVFLGNQVRDALFDFEPAIGKTVMLRGMPFVVIGVLAKKKQDSSYNGQDEDRACIPATTYARLFGRRFVDDFVCHSRSPEVHTAVISRIYEVLGRSKQFDASDRQALSVWDTTEQERMIFFIFLGLNLMMGVSGILTLVVGGIGVGNLMFILVRQRTREIGIQMALGARPRNILFSIMGEALILVALGGLIGFLISWSITSAVSGSSVTEFIGVPEISPVVALTTIAVLGSIGLLAGYFPARRASRLDPVLALAE